MTNSLFQIFLFIFKFSCILFSPIGVVTFCSFCSYFRRGYSLPRRKYPSTWHKENIFKVLLWDFPRAFVRDCYNSNPDAFPMDLTGLVIFEGKQGSGKSVGAVYYMDMLKKMYPRLQIMSNISLSIADSRLEDWQDMIFKGNGEYGQIVFLDEIQNYFNSLESKNFPPEMLQEICQQRKQRKSIIGTVQVFGRVAKPIREQTSMLVRPRTILGCLTILSCFKPSFDDNAQVTKMRRIKTHIFVHSSELRSAYDTFETVEHHALHGFKPRDQQILPDFSDIQKTSLDERRGLFKARKSR